jgi:hypothetical protein
MHEWRGIRLEGVRQEFIERRTSETEEERKIRLQQMKDANKKESSVKRREWRYLMQKLKGANQLAQANETGGGGNIIAKAEG